MMALSESIKTMDTKKLNEVFAAVNETDILLREFSESTEQLTSEFMKYSASNQGIRFEKAVSAANDLRADLLSASKELGEIKSLFAETVKQKGNTGGVLKQNSSRVRTAGGGRGSSGQVRISRADLLNVNNKIEEFLALAGKKQKALNDKKKSVAALWKDKNAFSPVVDTLTRKLADDVKVIDEFKDYLKNCMKTIS